MKINKFEDLEIWQISTDIAVKIYGITNKPKFSRDFGLKDQIRRASVSISSNIAEGFEMNNNNDFIRFLRISKGSIGEVKSQLLISYKLNYITKEEYDSLNAKLSNLSPMLGKFVSYLLGKKRNNEFATR